MFSMNGEPSNVSLGEPEVGRPAPPDATPHVVTPRLTREEVLELEVRYLRTRDIELQLKLLDRDVEKLLDQRAQGGQNLMELRRDLEMYRAGLEARLGVAIRRDNVRPDGTIVVGAKA